MGTDTNLQQQLKESFHSSALGGHSGERATYHRLKLLFYWPGMKSDISTFVKQCPTCQKNKSENKLTPGFLQPLPIPETAWTHITMDFIEGLPKFDNKDVIWTKYAHFIALSYPFTSENVVELFKTQFYLLHGLPSVIVSDRDRLFTSTVWKKVFEDDGVKLHFSSAYHPQTDGQSERVNQCLETYLRCLTFTKPRKWHSLPYQAEWWYNTNFHTSLNMTPYQALYGQKPPLVGEALFYHLLY